MDLQNLFFEVFDKKLDDPGSEIMLQGLSKKYPYFTAPPFFLLKKLDPADTNYQKIAARTALHFDNPFLLNYRVQEVERIDSIQEDENIVENNDLPAEPMIETIHSIEKVAETPKPEEVKNVEPMIFEPLFATDYFASQGIKLSEELKPDDKLGKQLKSFTEWLKSMKKTHEGKLPPGNEQVDLAVQKLAEKSNQEDDILTESMAEAYLQQRKSQKAVEIYQKLSLLNPAKSAYFAAKISEASLKQ